MLINIEKRWRNTNHSWGWLENELRSFFGDQYVIETRVDYGSTAEFVISRKIGDTPMVLSLECFQELVGHLGCDMWNIRFYV